jgi:hypothetical protein
MGEKEFSCKWEEHYNWGRELGNGRRRYSLRSNAERYVMTDRRRLQKKGRKSRTKEKMRVQNSPNQTYRNQFK